MAVETDFCLFPLVSGLVVAGMNFVAGCANHIAICVGARLPVDAGTSLVTTETLAVLGQGIGFGSHTEHHVGLGRGFYLTRFRFADMLVALPVATDAGWSASIGTRSVPGLADDQRLSLIGFVMAGSTLGVILHDQILDLDQPLGRQHRA